MITDVCVEWLPVDFSIRELCIVTVLLPNFLQNCTSADIVHYCARCHYLIVIAF